MNDRSRAGAPRRPRRPVVLIGPMAAGKSFLARHMSRCYGYGFVDADEVIVSRHGAIPQIFAEHGEQYFRDLEADVVAELLHHPGHADAILSVGGGAPTVPAVRELLRHELVAYLEVDAATVLPRISGNRTRPLLRPDPERRWRELLEARRACYEELADIRLDGTGDRPVAELGADLEAQLTRLRPRPAGTVPQTTQEAQA